MKTNFRNVLLLAFIFAKGELEDINDSLTQMISEFDPAEVAKAREQLTKEKNLPLTAVEFTTVATAADCFSKGGMTTDQVIQTFEILYNSKK